MKLNEFFQTQQTTYLTDIDKLELYQKFLSKKISNKSPLKRFSFVYARSFAYMSIATFLILGVYGVYFFQGGAFTSSVNSVQADYIAKVVEINGGFSIEHAGSLIKTDNISNGDTILLKDGAEMVFEISSGTKSKIIGPAKLTLQKISDTKTLHTKYKINFIYGDFIQMQGNQTVQNIELAVDDILIKQADQTNPVNFQFINDGGNHILRNNGSNLILTKNGTTKETQIGKQQILAIKNNDIAVYKDRATFAKAVSKGDVSQTFALNTKYTSVKTNIMDDTGAKTDESPVSLMSLLSNVSEDIAAPAKDDKISADIDALMDNEKTLVSSTQNSSLNVSLGAYFLEDEMKEIYTNAKTSKVNMSKIESRIKRIYSVLNLNYNENSSISNNINTLISTLSTKYEVNPKYVSNLKILNNWIVTLSQVSANSPEREVFTASLSSTLKFK